MSDPSGVPPTLPLDELESTFGVLFIGFVVATILYGFTFFQTYVYFSRYPKDNVFTKGTVILLALLDTATTALVSHALYFYLIDQFLVPVGLVDATATFCTENGLAILATFVVHIFFASRAYMISKKSIVLPLAIAIPAVVAFGFGVAMTAQIFKQRHLASFATMPMEAVAGVSQSLAGLADLIIVACMTYYLRPAHQPGMKMPETLFEKIVTIFVNHGVAVTIIQLSYFLVFIIMPSKQIWMPFHLVVSKVYINTVLSLLTSRDVFRGRGIGEEESVSLRKSSGGVTTSEGTRSIGIRFNKSGVPDMATLDFEPEPEAQREGSAKGKATLPDADESSFVHKAGTVKSTLPRAV